MTRRPSTVAIAIAPLLLVAAILFVSSPGGASHGFSCGASYTSTASNRSCALGFRGFPITVWGDSEAGSASVHSWVTVTGTDPVLLECTDAGGGFATCDAELGAGEGIDWLNSVPVLTCHGSGRGAWAFRCTSGCVSPALGIECELINTPIPEPSI